MTNQKKPSRNLTMLTDFYEITMSNGYFSNGYRDTVVYFDMFFRHIPDDGGFAIMAGVQQLIDYIKDLEFTDDDIAYLESTHMFQKEFLEYLRNFQFACDVWAIPEGTPIFPGEPIVTVRGPVIQAQLIETMLLLTINHQSMIATKANRIVRAAQGRAVHGIRVPPRTGSRRRHLRCAGRLHWGLLRHRLHHLRPGFRRPCPGHHGPQLGPAV